MSRLGLALAGGGPEGAIYEIGALRALEEVLEDVDLAKLEIYVGVSAGSFVAACLANGIGTGGLCHASVGHTHGDHPFVPETFFTPAFREILHRGLMSPRLIVEALWEYATHPENQTLLESLTRLSRALPVAIFENGPIRDFLQSIFAVEKRTDDFRKLSTRLFVVASDLDSGEAVCFGDADRDQVPISVAVQASTALPGLYPPVEIEGRSYVDGVLLKTLHASVGLEAGADLLICVNPIVPVDTARSISAGAMKRGRLVNRGLPTVLSQTFRTLVHSRLAAGIRAYEPRFPEQEIVLLEPGTDDYRMFFTNIFSFSSRKAICEHAYRSTRRQLWERRDELEPVFERHGIRFCADRLEDAERGLRDSIGPYDEPSTLPVVRRLERALTRLESLLDARG